MATTKASLRNQTSFLLNTKNIENKEMRMLEEKVRTLAIKFLEDSDFPHLAQWFTVNRIDMLKAGCAAVNGKQELLVDATAAVCCVHMGIKIIDDIIDEDQRGIQKELGIGQAANAAYIYQASAYKIILESNYPTSVKMKIINYLIHFAKVTSIGQFYDATQIETEQDFFHALSLKSGPLFGDCLRIGAAINPSATEQEIEILYNLGVIYGYLIQLNDDLSDTFKTPASNDWLPNRTNLPILYASNTSHEKQGRFKKIRNQVLENKEKLHEAQQILISSGAYFKVIEDIIWQAHLFRQLLIPADIENKQPLETLLNELMEPVKNKINSLNLTYSFEELQRWVINRRGQDT